MAASEESLRLLTKLPIPILHELLQYTDVRLQAALRRTCALFNHLLLPRVASCRDIRIFIPPRRWQTLFNKTLKRFHTKCLEWFGHSPIRTVIVEGPSGHVSQLIDFCSGLEEIDDLHFQQIIFIGQTFRDPFYLGKHIRYFCQDRLKNKNICQQLTFHGAIFSQFQNIMQAEDIIGVKMGREERKAYMVQEQIIPIRGSLNVHSETFYHDFLDLIERHCPEVNEEQMADIMQWKAAKAKGKDRYGMRYTLRGYIAHDDRPCNALYSKGWNLVDKESRRLVKAARTVDVRQMTKIARTAFFYSMKQARNEDERRAVAHSARNAWLNSCCEKRCGYIVNLQNAN